MHVCSYVLKLNSVFSSFNTESIKLNLFDVSKILTFPAWSAFRAEFSCFSRFLFGNVAKSYQFFLRFAEVMNQLLWDQCLSIVIFGRYDCFQRGAVVF